MRALSELGPELGAVGTQRSVHPATPGPTESELLTPLAPPCSLISQKGKCLRVEGHQVDVKFLPVVLICPVFRSHTAVVESSLPSLLFKNVLYPAL